MGNDQKSRCSSSTVIETHNFKILLFLRHGYYTPKLKNIAILTIFFSPYNFRILPTCHWILFGLVIQLNFFWRSKLCVIITIISNITVSVSHNVICFEYFMPISHGVNKKAPRIVSLNPPTNQVFTRLVCCFIRNTLSTLFFCSALTDYC